MLLLAAVMYSPNLGDGVIAECISAAALKAGQENIGWLDLAGRTEFSAPGNAGPRMAVLNSLKALPEPAAQTAMRALLEPRLRLQSRPAWRRMLARSEGVIIGGGQLLADTNLNFPLKLNALAQEARKTGAPLAIHAVGVSSRWSPAAGRLFSALFNENLKFVSVRDAASRDHLFAHLKALGGIKTPEIMVCPDPGVLAAHAFGGGKPDGGDHSRSRVGIGVTHPLTLMLHGGGEGAAMLENYQRAIARLASAGMAAGHEVTLFTNGAGEDENFAQSVAALCKVAGGAAKPVVAPRPQNPRALNDMIASFDAVIAHRLHANILAYAHRIPHIGLSWDPKLDAFFHLTGRSEYLFDGALNPVSNVVEALPAAMAADIDEAQHKSVLNMARQGVADVIAALKT